MRIEPSHTRKITDVFKSNFLYFEMMRDWHQNHGGMAIEPLAISLILAECSKGRKILDAGCGEGSVITSVARRCPSVTFVGVDVSRIGVQMASKNGLGNLIFHVADLNHLPYPSNSFDLVFCQSVLEHVVGWERVLMEFHRILRRDGKALIRLGNGAVHNRRIRAAFLDYLLKRTKVVSLNSSFKLSRGDYDAHMTNFDVQEIPSDILLEEFKSVGFQIEHFSTHTHAHTLESLSQWQKCKSFLFRIVSLVNIWPLNHLGPVTIILGRKTN